MSNNTWPPMDEWESLLPKEQPMRSIAHTDMYKEHNNRIEARHAREALLGHFPKGQAEEFASPQRQELTEVLASLRARLKR